METRGLQEQYYAYPDTRAKFITDEDLLFPRKCPYFSQILAVVLEKHPVWLLITLGRQHGRRSKTRTS